MSLSTSVALCTYNGERYLAQQLASIAAQSLKPGELVVCDDRSSDATPALLERFASAAGFPVRVHRNPTNLGSTRNFDKAISLCTGQIIFLCDQDDLWSPHKVARTLDAFERHPDAALVITDGQVIDAQDAPVGPTLWQSVGFLPRERDAFLRGQAISVLLKHNVVTGAAAAFRADRRDLLLPIDPRWVQDAWIGLLLAAVAPCAIVAEPLVRYRQHAQQQVGVRQGSLPQQVARSRNLSPDHLRDLADQLDTLAARLEAKHDTKPNATAPASAALVRAKARHCRARADIQSRQGPWLRRSMSECLNRGYARYSLGLKSLVRDLVMR